MIFQLRLLQLGIVEIIEDAAFLAAALIAEGIDGVIPPADEHAGLLLAEERLKPHSV